MKALSWAVVAVLLAGFAAAVGVSGRASASTSSDQLVGAGSSFVAPLVSKWQSDYPSKTGVQIVYSPIGSGGGIAAISARTVDFGASDAPLTPDQFAGCKGCSQIPWALGGTAIMFNVHTNAHAPLKISGPVLAQIYLGAVKTWNAPAIRKLNPGIKLPDEPIVPVYRSDGSGTSYNFTDYLSTQSKAWKSKIGISTQPSFPKGVGAKGSSGVAGVVQKTAGAIGYADIAYAISNRISTMAVKNAAGKFTTPGIGAISAAAAAFKTVGRNNEMHIVNPPKSAPKAYPISTYTYVILPQVTPKAAQLRKFVFYALTTGQKLGVPLRYVPIPKSVLVASERTLAKIHS
jgi:phosphate transport system substrate-binding protein